MTGPETGSPGRGAATTIDGEPVTSEAEGPPGPVPPMEDPPEIELSDADILDAMQHIPGYLDITTEDFRAIYHLAHRHAVDRVHRQLRAARLMRVDIAPIAPDMALDAAARAMARSGYKGLPVVDSAGRVVGMLTETDFLRCLQAESFLDLFQRLLGDPEDFRHRCHGTLVSVAMTSPAVTVPPEAGYLEMLEAFRRHGGRSMPVTDAQARLCGLLLRKDFLGAFEPAIPT
jgi:CBS domain-containing membrane protein